MLKLDFLDALERRVRRGGLRFDGPDPRDLFFDRFLRDLRRARRSAAAASSDLRAGFSATEDQGDLGSCTAQAWVGVMEYHLRASGAFADLSRLGVYYRERETMGTLTEDSGATIRCGAKVCRNVGASRESLWPYDVTAFAAAPSAEAAADEPARRLSDYYRVRRFRQLLGIREALSLRLPVAAGILCHKSMFTPAVAESGSVPMPSRGESAVGGHAVVLCGHDDAARVVRFRNSWGASWGDGGYGTLPYEYVDDMLLTSDCWVASGVTVKS